jgi:pSer/pThr/pTyr-binding forkhead associated (FHA) protein
MPEFAQLVELEGARGAPRRWDLAPGVTTIGRSEDSDIVLADREVSRRHAQIRNEAGSYVLVDLGSTNGTMVNGVRVERSIPLRSGDLIMITPSHRLQFLDSDATIPVSSSAAGLTIDQMTRKVTVNGVAVDPPLAPIQFALLSLLASEPRRVFSRDEIAQACYPEAEGGVSDQAIDGVVRRLRARLAEADATTPYIVAVRGHGYRLIPPAGP